MMKLDLETNRNLRKNLAELLSDLSDLETTRLAWTAKLPGIIRNYTEDVENFFTDILGGKDLRWNVLKGLLSETEAEILTPFFEKFKQFVRNNDGPSEEEILHNPQWQQLAELAADASKKIGSNLRS